MTEMKIEVIEHTYETKGGFHRHKAIVKVKNYDGNIRNLASTTSRKVGYHPGGYGLYEVKAPELLQDGTMIIRWETSDSCD